MSRDRPAGPAGASELARFLDLLRDGLGLELTEEQAAADFDTLSDWDSVHLLRLVMVLERETGRPVPVGRVLLARSMREIHELVGPIEPLAPVEPAGPVTSERTDTR